MYCPMKTRPIKPQVKKTHNLKQKITNTLEDCFDSRAFSTFPYINKGLTSKQAMNKTNSGNCISLSTFIKDQLKKQYGISSHLVPATVPSYIHRDGFLDICHVALLIPINNSSYYLVDPAFYLMEPMLIHTKNPINPVRAVNIHDNNLDTIYPTLHTSPDRLQLNQYQTMPKHTKYCECYSNEKSDDTWKYYLREIMNPDQAISKFFTAIRGEPFFVSTKMENGICKKDMTIRKHDGDSVSIKMGDQQIYDGHTLAIPSELKQQLIDLLQSKNFDPSIVSF